MTAVASRRLRILGLLLVVLLAFVRLGSWPIMWFDEGVHLHVPKAVVLFGVYADYSSEGFRHYGPTMSVGPTVFVPMAAAFKVFGIGLVQARAVVATYLVVAVILYFALARRMGGQRLAWAATTLVVTSRTVDLLYLGRQGLGEVPALVFVLGGLLVWYRAWHRPRHGSLAMAGVLFGLAVVTKYQVLIVLAPGLTLAWLLNRVYHRVLPDRVFAWPLALTLLAFAGWQAAGILYLGPSTASENLALMRRAVAGAALGFSTDNVKRAAATTLSFWLYGALLFPALVHAAARGLERSKDEFRWVVVLCFVVPNLAWFLLASIGWPRYAFPAYALGGLLVARLASDLTSGFRLPALLQGRGEEGARAREAVAAAVWVLLATAVVLPFARQVGLLVSPPENFPKQAAAYLEQHVPKDAIVETWEPELGFLTDHRYHYPPSALLIDAVAYQFGRGPSPFTKYDFRAGGSPAYLVRGEFAKWVDAYPDDRLEDAYRLMADIGAYSVYERVGPGSDARDTAR